REFARHAHQPAWDGGPTAHHRHHDQARLGAKTEQDRPMVGTADMKNPDPDALAIGELYRKALGDEAPRKAHSEDTKPRRGSVTPIRLISGKLSGSRNGKYDRNDDIWRSIDANACHWCDERFKRGQMRYPIMTDCGLGWSAVSVCMECF